MASASQPILVGEYTALDFLNSIASPKSDTIDWLASNQGLLDWMVHSDLCTATEIAPLQERKHQDVLTQQREAIVTFREDFRQQVENIIKTQGSTVNTVLISDINILMAQGTVHMAIEPASGNAAPALRLEPRFRCDSPLDLLPRIAASCADFLTTADLRYVRKCKNPKCTLYFCDISKGHKRSWCSMDICGNRAKAAAYREAKKKQVKPS